jgi:NAD(P)-dependent dehydrogenase (short-subunit alcohol dehydrogenase family)
MTSRQTSINSGFGARSTAADVVKGMDLGGKTAIVTGGYSGLGLEMTQALAGAGATVIVGARRMDKAFAALSDIAEIEIQPLELSNLQSVQEFADHIISSRRHIDILINSAGIMACPECRVGPGWEAQFAINHLGPFALTNHLWPALNGDARVVTVSSGAHRITGIRWPDLHFETGYDKWQAYGQSKTANVLFSVHLDTSGEAAGVRAFALHPGSILTPLQRHLPTEEMVAAGWIDEAGNLADSSFKTREQGAATAVWAATSPQLAGMGGVYA